MPREGGERVGEKTQRMQERDSSPIKFDHLLHPDHEISRLMGTENPRRH